MPFVGVSPLAHTFGQDCDPLTVWGSLPSTMTSEGVDDGVPSQASEDGTELSHLDGKAANLLTVPGEGARRMRPSKGRAYHNLATANGGGPRQPSVVKVAAGRGETIDICGA